MWEGGKCICGQAGKQRINKSLALYYALNNAPINACNAPLPQVWAEGEGWLGLVGEVFTKFARGGGDF